jgi:excisionase family DNA binding protein
MNYANLISVTQAAKFLKISKETIYRRLKEGSLPHYRIGKLYKFLPVELMKSFKVEKKRIKR